MTKGDIYGWSRVVQVPFFMGVTGLPHSEDERRSDRRRISGATILVPFSWIGASFIWNHARIWMDVYVEMEWGVLWNVIATGPTRRQTVRPPTTDIRHPQAPVLNVKKGVADAERKVLRKAILRNARPQGVGESSQLWVENSNVNPRCLDPTKINQLGVELPKYSCAIWIYLRWFLRINQPKSSFILVELHGFCFVAAKDRWRSHD